MKRKKFKKRGFTLIELLAIIVILALIAVITVPIILNIIENSKKGAVQESAYGYKDAVHKLYVSKLIDGPDKRIGDGVYDVSELKNMGVAISGEEPVAGWVELVNGRVVSFSLKFGEYVVTMYVDSDVVILKSSIVDSPSDMLFVTEIVESLEGTVSSDGAKYLATVREIYFDPTTNQECNSSDSVSTIGTVSGCMHWYLYSVKDNYANMLLDHNITLAGSQNGVWASAEDYAIGLTDNGHGYLAGEGEGSKAISAGITYPNSVTSFSSYGSSNNSRGPVTALNTLKDLTSSWKTGVPKVPNISDINEHVITSDMNSNKYQINYSNYHARLITKQELSYIKVADSDALNWLKDGINYSSDPIGYWTSSPYDYSLGFAWRVDYSSVSIEDGVINATTGIRPVITVPIVYLSSLSED